MPIPSQALINSVVVKLKFMSIVRVSAYRSIQTTATDNVKDGKDNNQSN